MKIQKMAMIIAWTQFKDGKAKTFAESLKKTYAFIKEKALTELPARIAERHEHHKKEAAKKLRTLKTFATLNEMNDFIKKVGRVFCGQSWRDEVNGVNCLYFYKFAQA